MMSIDVTKLFVREFEKNDGTILKFYQAEVGDVGCVVWDAALVLSKYLEKVNFSNVYALKSKVVVELGSGTGAVGLVASSLGAHVTVTDLPEIVPLMNYNIQVNAANITGTMQATSFIWGTLTTWEIPASPDLVLLADCLYYDQSLEPLVKSIHWLCDSNTQVLCCFERRDTGNTPDLERRFFQLISVLFSIEEIPREKHDQQFSSDDIKIFQFHLKEKVS